MSQAETASMRNSSIDSPVRLRSATDLRRKNDGSLSLDQLDHRMAQSENIQFIGIYPLPSVSNDVAESHVRGKIILVDDDEMVRETIGDQLSLAGFDVAMFDSGQAALDYVDAGATVDALITDLSMPRMDGVSLIKQMQQRHPGLPSVLLTGFAINAAAMDMTNSMMVLRKPVSGRVLVQRIDTMIQ